MKLKRINVSTQLLVLVLAALVLGLMVQFAQAQSLSSGNEENILQTQIPTKGFGQRLRENTTLTYYQQFLGPTLTGDGGETYNVFQEGRAPYQSFHTANLRHQIDNDWAVGASLAVVTAYGSTVTAQQNGSQSNMVRDEFFNPRFYVTVPAFKTSLGNLYTTVAYEAPTSNTSRLTDMRWGWVLTQSFAFNLPSIKWNAGFMGQYYRAYFENNSPTNDNRFNRQTVIANVGPYASYRFNDKWLLSSLVTFDWDQRGTQTETREFNNNLEDRARATVTYFPGIKYLTSVGAFTQANLDYSTTTQVFGAEVALKF